jgi:gluconate 2-dehydrogenase gamma chain
MDGQVGANSAALTFFSEIEALTVDAMAARIIPSDASGPGAREAEAVVYIDRALAGFYRDLQTLYRRGVRELDRLSRESHGAPFRDLDELDQDAVLRLVDALPEAAESRAGSQSGDADGLLPQFFAVVRRHTIEGLFCDPVYGGNRDKIGWRLVGFPGAQWSYSAEQMQPGFDARQIPVKTLEDLRREYGRVKAEPVEERSQ